MSKIVLNPEIVKTMSFEQLNDLADYCREEIINVTSQNGGHLSSNLGSVELSIALIVVFDALNDDLLFDVGHQAYTYKMLTGRDISNIRTKGGLSPFLDKNESIYDKYSSGHSSTSISTAVGMALANKLKSKDTYVVATIGDASMINGLSFEGLNSIGDLDLKNLIIVINDNGMSIGPTRGGLAKKSMIDEEFFKAMDIDYIGPVDGHDIKSLVDVLDVAKKHGFPCIVHVKTQKGHGYSPAMADEDGYWHGVTPFDLTSLAPLNMHLGQISFSHAKSDILYDFINKNNNLVLINPAMVKGAGEDNIFKDFKDRTFDVGIAEEHAFTFAAGLALKGFYPIITIYSTFFQRAFDECFEDLSHQNLSAVILLERSGLIGADGETHQGIYDLALIFEIPNAYIYEPYDYDSLWTIMNRVLTIKRLNFVRIPRELLVKSSAPKFVDEFKWVNGGSNTIVVTFGIEGKKYVEMEDEYDTVICLSRNITEEFVNELLEYERIIIYDSTSTYNGYSSYLISQIMLQKGDANVQVEAYALKNEFVKHAKISEQLIDQGLDCDRFYNKIHD